MPLPTTDAELKALGYIAIEDALCRGCHQSITWYRTPNGKLMPFNRVTLTPHHATCPKAELFRRSR